MIKHFIRSFLFLGLSSSAALAATPSSALERGDAARIMACMQANLPERFSVEEFVLSSSNADASQQTLSGQFFFTRVSRTGDEVAPRAMMRIEYPQALRDASYLVISSDDYLRDGMFVYMPAVDRVRRIAGTFADGRLFGTDLSYYDYKQFRNAFGDMQPSWMGADTHQGRSVDRMRFTPSVADETSYDHVDALIDRKSCLPLKLDFYENGRLRKVLDVPAESIRADGKRWYMQEFTIRDLRGNTATTMRTTGFSSSAPLSDALFHPASFYRGQ